jgi:hypothetical protein
MKSSLLPPTAPAPSKPGHRTRIWNRKTGLYAFGLTLPIVVMVAVAFINAHWPYRYSIIKPLLQEVFASQVKIGHYHRIYFPNPGFMATEITLRRDSAPDLPSLGSVSSVTVRGTWLDLLMFRKRVSLVSITGLHIVIPPLGSRANHEDFPPGSSASFGGPTAVIELLHIHDSVLDILRTDGSRYSFPIRMLTIHNLQKGQELGYSVDMQNAKPTGHIFSTGKFGPLNADNLGATPLSGDFTFSSVNLSDIGKISGTLASVGHFEGYLAALELDATTNTPDFAVGSGKATPFTASVHCTVDGLNGDVILRGVDAKIGKTPIHVQGGIVGSPKVANVDITVISGRVQDILRPFLQNEVPVAGMVELHSHARLGPSGNESTFLQRLRVDGDFDVPAERLTDRATEHTLSAFSQRARGGNPSESDPGSATLASADSASSSSTDVLSSLNGHATIRDGVVFTRRIMFRIPGAAVDLNGSFNFRDSTVRLLGNLHMDSDVSHTTTGLKSVLMKLLIPFFKKDKAGAVIPIAVTGSKGGYKVAQNVLPRK